LSAAAGDRELPEPIATAAVPSSGKIDWPAVVTELGRLQRPIGHSVIAGVNPPVIEAVLTGWSQTGWPHLTNVAFAAQLPLRVDLAQPDHVGIDRLLDGVAANRLRAGNEPAIVVDAGTATTVNLVAATGVFVGGAILPGLELAARSLHQYTALLPLVDVQLLRQNPVDTVGKDTRAAIGSGIWFGQIGAIRELVSQMSTEARVAPLVLVTGGNGRALSQALGNGFRFEPHLALRALAYVAETL
jgi:type III pantothenate kinase